MHTHAHTEGRMGGDSGETEGQRGAGAEGMGVEGAEGLGVGGSECDHIGYVHQLHLGTPMLISRVVR